MNWLFEMAFGFCNWLDERRDKWRHPRRIYDSDDIWEFAWSAVSGTGKVTNEVAILIADDAVYYAGLSDPGQYREARKHRLEQVTSGEWP